MKGEAYWIAGIGFSAIQIFFYLEKWWSYTIYSLFCLFCWFLWLKLPREIMILYYIVITLIYAFLYYWLHPDDALILFFMDFIK